MTILGCTYNKISHIGDFVFPNCWYYFTTLFRVQIHSLKLFSSQSVQGDVHSILFDKQEFAQ